MATYLGKAPARLAIVTDDSVTSAKIVDNTVTSADILNASITGADLATDITINTTGTITGTFSGNITGDVTGNADTATTLATARTIAGQSFDGSANITIASTDLSNTSDIVLLTSTQTLTNKTLTSPTITGTGAIAGTFTGNITGDVTGNADTATALETARTIAGQSFDGSANITIASTDLSDTSSITLNTATQTLTNKTLGATTIAGHLIPDTNITYDLGSSTFRFRDLYLSGNSIELGSATITASGSSIVLPSGSTISGGNGDVADLNSSQTLTNKTLTSPAFSGTATNFTSTGIDDNATSTAITINSSDNVTFTNQIFVTGNINGSDEVIAERLQLSGSTDSLGSDNGFAFIFKTGGAGSAPFNQAGALLYQPRTHTTEGRSNHLFYTGNPLALRQNIHPNGDISFYEDTGTTAKLFWDASTERLGIGTVSPISPLTVNSASNGVGLFYGNTGNNYIEISDNNNTNKVSFGSLSGGNAYLYSGSGKYTAFYSGASERMRIDSSGTVNINTTADYSSIAKLVVYDSVYDGDVALLIKNDRYNNSGATATLKFEQRTHAQQGNAGKIVSRRMGAYSETSGSKQSALDFYTAQSATDNLHMSIINNGNVGIGLTNPTGKLHAVGGEGFIIDKTNNGYSGTRIHDDSAGDYNSYIDLGRNQNGTRLTIRKGGRVQGTTPWTNGTPSAICSFAHGGIAFGSDTDTADTLDDYEEGTWTPSLSSGSPGNTSALSGSVAYSFYNRGYYTKIGRAVTINFYLALTNKGTGSGDLWLAGSSLPFTSSGVYVASMYQPVMINKSGQTTPGFLYGTWDAGSGMRIGLTDGNTNLTFLQHSTIASNFNLSGHMTYFV